MISKSDESGQEHWTKAVVLVAAAYFISVIADFTLTFILTRPQIKPVFEWAASIVPLNPGAARFSSYSIGSPKLDPASWIPYVIIFVYVLAMLHIAILFIVNLIFRWRGWPFRLSDLRRERGLLIRIATSTLKDSAWRASWVLPVAAGTWAIWYGVSEATIVRNPWFLAPESIAFWSNRVAVVLVYVFVTGAALHRNVLHELGTIGPRCMKCGYPLGELPSPRCPECGSIDSGSSVAVLEVRGFFFFRQSWWSRIARWLMVAFLLLTPILFPPLSSMFRVFLGQ